LEDYFGERHWQKYLVAATANEEPTTAAEVLPPPVPENEDFACIPLLRPLIDYHREPPKSDELFGKIVWHDLAGKQRLVDAWPLIGFRPPQESNWRAGIYFDVNAWDATIRREKPEEAGPSGPPGTLMLRHLQKHNPGLEALRAGISRPAARFVREADAGMDMDVRWVDPLWGYGKLARLRAEAELALGDSGAAADDISLGLRLARAAGDNPVVVGAIMAYRLTELPMGPIWGGLARHQWNETQLAALEQALAHLDPLSIHQRSMYGERILYAWPNLDAIKRRYADPADVLGMPDTSQLLLSLIPGGCFDFNKATLGEYYGQMARMADPAAHRFFVTNAQAVGANLARKMQSFSFDPNDILHGYLRALTDTTGNIVQFAAQAQATIDLARCAIAIERYRLKHRSLPATLDALSPEFLVPPRDVITGEPLHYRPAKDSATYLLYSVGANEKDDGGTQGWNKLTPSQPDFTVGDWVWPQPSAAP
jgi:hypothetical protein